MSRTAPPVADGAIVRPADAVPVRVRHDTVFGSVFVHGGGDPVAVRHCVAGVAPRTKHVHDRPPLSASG